MKKYLFLYLLVLGMSEMQAQLRIIENYDFPEEITGFSNYSWRMYVQTNKGIFYWKRPLPEYSKENAIAISPLGTELLLANPRGELIKYNPIIFKEISKHNFPKGIIIEKFIFDGLGQRVFGISDKNNLYDIRFEKEKMVLDPISNDFFVSNGVWNNNLNYMLIADDRYLFYYDINEQKSLDRIAFDYHVTAIATSESNYENAVGFSTGEVVFYNQALTAELRRSKISHAEITSISYHSIDHYVFIGDSEGTLFVYNTLKDTVISSEKIHYGDIKSEYLKNSTDNQSYLITSGGDTQLKLWDLNYFEPNYNRIVNEKLAQKMEGFLKRRRNETSQAYADRSNENTLATLKTGYRQTLVDSLAASKYKSSEPIYSVFEDTLQVAFADLKIVKIPLNSQKLELTVGITGTFKFDLLPNNDFIIAGANISSPFLPMPLVYSKDIKLLPVQKEPSIALLRELANKEYDLKVSLSSLVDKLRAKGELNDVELDMESVLKKEKDSLGNEELNLHITYVSQGIRAEAQRNTADYAAGKYNLFDSKAATTLVGFFVNSVEDKLEEYLQPDTRVTFKLTGSTDKSKVSSKISYANEFESFSNYPYYYQGDLAGMNLNKEEGILENKQLAFLRTYSVRSFIETQTSNFDLTKNKFIHYAEEGEGYGPEFRRIKIEMVIHAIDKQRAMQSSQKIAKESLSDVDINIPIRSNNKAGYALVIGNEDYSSFQKGLSKESNVAHAVHDAEVVKNYLQEMFQMNPSNIELLLNGTYGEMSQAIARLEKIMEIDGAGKEIIVYYSGHGMPDETNKDPYLIPVDISGLNVSQGIPLKEMMARLSQKPHDKITFVIDACFSGAGRNAPLAQVKGVRVTPRNPELGDKMVLLSSSSGNESSLADDQKQHGLFTYYFLKKLQESNGTISIDRLFSEVGKNVSLEAVKKFNKSQTPGLLLGKSLMVDKDNLEFFMPEK